MCVSYVQNILSLLTLRLTLICVKYCKVHGCAHLHFVLTGLASDKHTSLATVRSIQQVGGKVDVMGSREFTLFSAQAPRNGINEGRTMVPSRATVFQTVLLFFSDGILYFHDR